MSKYEVFSGPNLGKYGTEKIPYSDTSRSETHFRCGSVSEFAFDNQITIATFLLQALFSRNLAVES